MNSFKRHSTQFRTHSVIIIIFIILRGIDHRAHSPVYSIADLGRVFVHAFNEKHILLILVIIVNN